mmetsp:Transcript_9336/g.15207  ORF Transcript_9336/g.15207 Transcript_9336/m.15207 type:complete len:454 (+) Transcript_9336:91-1452(+)|eukprot:CAMPEP_0203760672 /NCGR_PEP_ID=MMETSP0098-20131031/13917_1 /ASSEMBLY_ACC=CAM_ASM_000208 /TAXON_ID=96639 /ORGANISM=" , Strain NY0313808BC1" /LENGTH=453 /DNA_ID=CAMNT_0050654343 /DNA_START=92 /DNA_END=1453 /DNA_ORIENTATION=-
MNSSDALHVFNDDVMFGVMDADRGCGSSVRTAEVTNGVEKNDDQEWFERRRVIVSQASKNARKKKKREMETLQLENKRLRLERAQFLLEIEELVAKVQEMREQGDIDLHIENELLKAQLEEHKNFVGALREMAVGIPTNDATRRRIYTQGADYAISHTLSLLTRSVKENAKWLQATIPEDVLDKKTLNSVKVWYRYVDDFKTKPTSFVSAKTATVTDDKKTRKRLHVRIDHLLPGVTMAEATDLYWSIWNENPVLKEFFQQAQSDVSPKLEHLIEDSIEKSRDPTNPITSTDPSRQDIIISYSREKNEEALADKEWVFVSTKTSQDISKAALHLPKTGEIDCTTCNVLSRSTTTNHELSPSKKSGKAVRRIKSIYVEGCVIWDAPEENDGKNCCRMATVVSMPENFNQSWLSGPQDIVDANGCLADKFRGYLKGFVKLLSQKMIDKKKKSKQN